MLCSVMVTGNKILLVEDDDSLRPALAAFLDVHNDVDEAPSLTIAKELVLKNRYTLVLLDKGLPDGNGVDLVRLISESSPEAAVIIMTGDGDYNTVSKCISNGADDYIVKSENLIPDLLLRIPVALSHAELRQHRQHADLLSRVHVPKIEADLSHKFYRQYMGSAEKVFLEAALSICKGDAGAVAQRIGIAKSTIFKKMMELGIQRRPWHRRAQTNGSPIGEKQL